MRFRLNKTHESFSSSLMSRSRQIWWVARNLMKCDYLSRFWVVFRWWIALNLMKWNRLSRLIKSTYVARQVENEHTSFVESRLDNQNIDDEMIKQDHENKSSQTISAWKICIVFLRSHLTRSRTNHHRKLLHEKICIVFLKLHLTSRQNAKHVINIFSQQIASSIFIAIATFLRKIH
jgi:hypothetical protein